MRHIFSAVFRRVEGRENGDFWENTAKIDDSLAISPLKTMRYPQSPSVEKAWENVGRHLYRALGNRAGQGRGKAR
ncbi:MAG: hypothetical protein DU429_04480 [Candidatus Tokpelaia sp.]|uniref:hypothetical protein n=1 Tax=Candidatus Tokpelaia sp. TaxID=2233777 RepID=UPI00123AAE30|nr:hypothetical protein [Candidatus Tokpelaia sp.]KAA6204920.1 MAG: hypothetical protein DU430_05905 [Candidatus Tokpelaia sp.]KAA6207101.1 MAG: hypothetical protein DU429_04480 [Candidatus Tokpelaia sp.]KAA6405361.1 hypothetical protein DPQ22_04675 [Candidatus Tokpelaia sp.]